MADHVEAFISTLKRPEPAIARVGARAAHQQREPLAAAPLGGGEVGGVESAMKSVATTLVREVTSSMTACLNRLLMVNAPWWVRMS
jgi:hypothetical protein